jgi:hypothetical protein
MPLQLEVGITLEQGFPTCGMPSRHCLPVVVHDQRLGGTQKLFVKKMWYKKTKDADKFLFGGIQLKNQQGQREVLL